MIPLIARSSRIRKFAVENLGGLTVRPSRRHD
jgi:hypothetical protein